MFFRKMTDKERENTEKATNYGFVFYMLALSASSIYSFFQVPEQQNVSFMILIAGIIFFFASDFVLNKIKK